MWLFVWNNNPSAVYVWSTPASKVFVGTTQVRPSVVPPTENYLCFTAQSNWSSIQLTQARSFTPTSLEVSSDGYNWNSYNIWNVIILDNGDKVYWRNASDSNTDFSQSNREFYRFVMWWTIKGSWDINYLINKESTDTVGDYCFFRLFENCDSLITPPELPATTLWRSCYENMFINCTSLIDIPELPATTLQRSCYQRMFYWDICVLISDNQTSWYQTPYRIPASGTWTDASNSMRDMFADTWWDFVWTPIIDTTYYIHRSSPHPTGWGIYWNQSQWLISCSSDWTNWITIADKNLWATQVYSYWDTLSENVCGKFFQRWNNYWFPRTWPTSTSTTQVDASSYGPWNYYSDSTFIISSDDWSSIPNDDLWGDTTDTLSARQWPCLSWFHVPTQSDWTNLFIVWVYLWIWSAWNPTLYSTYLKLPRTGCIRWFDWELDSFDLWEYWTSNTWGTNTNAMSMYFSSSAIVLSWHSQRANGYAIRPFANTPVVPDSSWTVLYQPI